SRRSADDVREEWAQLKLKHQALLSDLELTVLPANLGADRVIYRLLVGPIADRDSARALCKNLTEKKVGCRVVSSAP
ncbi:MAG: SPOR domain-containing protein, partial [Proteobacteria bacterium]|nr:SPOR domain-containing protein [Pseudomonadota bacterium]